MAKSSHCCSVQIPQPYNHPLNPNLAAVSGLLNNNPLNRKKPQQWDRLPIAEHWSSYPRTKPRTLGLLWSLRSLSWISWRGRLPSPVLNNPGTMSMGSSLRLKNPGELLQKVSATPGQRREPELSWERRWHPQSPRVMLSMVEKAPLGGCVMFLLYMWSACELENIGLVAKRGPGRGCVNQPHNH